MLPKRVRASLRFMLQRRLPRFYAAQEVRLGDPIYESIKKQVLLDDLIRRERDKDKVKERILTRLQAMVDHDEANDRQAHAVQIACDEAEFVAAAGPSGIVPAGDWFGDEKAGREE